MDRIVECVPNFSEGRKKEVIDEIANAVRATPGCILLDVDPGASTNRTVYTFVEQPSAVVQGALNSAKVASKLIDMSKHKGEHPRLGAMDVCPFIPVRGVSLQECAECARQLADLLSRDLDVPVFLYGAAATQEYTRTVPHVRAGEYVGLAKKMQDERWRPDYGPTHFRPQWGATMAGARQFLIAYNVSLLSTKQQAHRERIIEYRLPDAGTGPLISLSTEGFIRAVGSRTPAPGGGSVAALLGALGAALSTMVGQMTYGRRKFEEHDTSIRRLIPVVHGAMVSMVPIVDADTKAFDKYMCTAEEAEVRTRALQNGLEGVVEGPVGLARMGNVLWPTLKEVAEMCNITTASDLQVGARCLETSVMGAYYNVVINLRQYTDSDARQKTLAEIKELVDLSRQGCATVLEVLELRLESANSSSKQ